MNELTPDVEARLWELALVIRETEEKLLDLFKEGKISGTVHTCVGQEFSGVCVCTQLTKEDFIFSNHRGHGHFLAWTRNVEGLLAELMGKKTGVCGGLGGSQHLHQDHFFSNGIQGGIAPVSLGLALARKIQKRGGIGAVFLGDGTLGEGAVYESLNLASRWELPLLFVLEDNGIAQSTPTRDTTAGNIADRARAFGLEVFEGATSQWRDLYRHAGAAIEAVREQGRPVFLIIKTSRLRAHSKSDDTREENELENLRRQDPLYGFVQKSENRVVAENARRQVEAACRRAESAEPAVLPPQLRREPPTRWNRLDPAPEIYLGQAIHQSFRQIMGRRENVYFIGEDVRAPYGGAFKVSRDLSVTFPERVLNTPISEAALVGLGTGLSIAGYKPFIEIMFGDFLFLGADQLVNHAAKFQQMYRSDFSVDVTVRTPMGGRRGYGPTHSQSLEKHFLGVPGLRVLALNAFAPPEKVYLTLAEKKCGPTLLVENKVAYTHALMPSRPAGFEVLISDQEFPVTVIRPQARRVDFSILCHGGMAEEAVDAADVLFRESEILCQVIVPTQLYPFSLSDCGDFLDQAPDLLAVEEASGFGSFSSEFLAQLAERGRGPRVHRLAAPEICVPGAAHLEREILPGSRAIAAKIISIRS